MQTILIKLYQIHQNHPTSSPLYFSFSIQHHHHFFTPCITENSTDLGDDIIIKLHKGLPNYLELHRWENHCIMYSHMINIIDIADRTYMKIEQQTKHGEFLSFMVMFIGEDMKYSDKFVKEISQHYLTIGHMHLLDKKDKTKHGLNYFNIKTENKNFILPIKNGSFSVQLPQNFEFFFMKNGKQEANSPSFSSNELTNKLTKLTLDGKDDLPLVMVLQWSTNLHQTKSALVSEEEELLIYDMEVKLQNHTEYSNAKIKFAYDNRSYEIGHEFNNPKSTKIKKIIHMPIRSNNQEVNIILERNFKTLAMSTFYAHQIDEYCLENKKMNLADLKDKVLGSIKFKCQRGKRLSVAENNRYFAQTRKKKVTNHTLICLEQFSVVYNEDVDIQVVIKTQIQQKVVANVPNLKYFNENREILLNPIVLQQKAEQNVYLMLRQAQRVDENFIGIALINFSEFRLGVNILEIPVFKNQAETGIINCIINKLSPFPFIKPIFQTHNFLLPPSKTVRFSLRIQDIQFTPYYYTYEYQNKDSIECRLEVGKSKKVFQIQHDDDLRLKKLVNFEFGIESLDLFNIKFMFVVSDMGKNEQIYGIKTFKIKLDELMSSQIISWNKVEFKNNFQTVVGYISAEIHLNNTLATSQIKESLEQNELFRPRAQSIDVGSSVLEKKSMRSDLRKVKRDLTKINENMERMEKSIENKRKRKSVNPIRNMLINSSVQDKYEGNSSKIRYKKQTKQKSRTALNQEDKLPPIKKFRKEDLDSLIRKMKGKGKKKRVRIQTDDEMNIQEERQERNSEPNKLQRIKEKYRNYMKREEEMFEAVGRRDLF